MSSITKEDVRLIVRESIEQNVNENFFQDASRSLVSTGMKLGIVKPVVTIMGYQFQIPAWLFNITTASFAGIPAPILIGVGAGMAVYLLDVLVDVMKDRRLREKFPEYNTIVRDLTAIRQEKFKDSDELSKRLTVILSSIRNFMVRIEEDDSIGKSEKRQVINKMHDAYRTLNNRYGSRAIQQASVGAG